MMHNTSGPQSPQKESLGQDIEHAIQYAVHNHEMMVRRISILTVLLFIILIIVLVW